MADAGKKNWDLSSTSALQAAAAWVLKRSGALLVVIVRVDDLAIAADAQLAPRDSAALLEDRMPGIHARLQMSRVEAQQKQTRRTERETNLFRKEKH